MNELDSRLVASNPVRSEDVLSAETSAAAADLLNHILSQPAVQAGERQSPPRRLPTRAWIAAAAVILALVVGVGVSGNLTDHRSARISSPGSSVVGFRPGPSQGVATNAVKLVDYATRAAALAPTFVPRPHDWMYRDLLGKLGRHSNREVTWWEVNWSHTFARWPNGKVVPTGSSTGKCAGQLGGWPGCINNVYRYLATLPANPARLRHVILANNHYNSGAAFRAIDGLLEDYPLPPRFQAELYAVLTGLHGVRFDRSAKDFAGRHGIGLYQIQAHFWKMEMIINPRTYTYMGVLVVAAKTHTEYGHLVRKGQIQAWTSVLGSAIVKKAGQVP